jgi:hypothetical protein
MKTELKKRGIECDDATKAQSILDAEKCANGEGNFQLAAKTELKKREIECDDATKAQSIVQSDKCAKGEGNFQLHAAKELRKQGIECDDPTKARSILNSINNPMKNPEFSQTHSASIKWDASNLSYKGDKWKKAEIEQLRELCKTEYSITKIAETMNCEVASKRTVHNKIFKKFAFK